VISSERFRKGNGGKVDTRPPRPVCESLARSYAIEKKERENPAAAGLRFPAPQICGELGGGLQWMRPGS
jgi:hypothetical protein